MQWKVAAIALITFPLAIWLSTIFNESERSALLFVGFLPVLVGVIIELSRIWQRSLRDPNYCFEGSPSGNKIAIALGLILLVLLFMVVAHFLGYGA